MISGRDNQLNTKLFSVIQQESALTPTRGRGPIYLQKPPFSLLSERDGNYKQTRMTTADSILIISMNELKDSERLLSIHQDLITPRCSVPDKKLCVTVYSF